MFSWRLFFLLFTCRAQAAVVDSVADESCLLQTRAVVDNRDHRHDWQGAEDNKSEDDSESYEMSSLGDLKIGDAIPSFDIDLDLPAEKRFLKVSEHFKTSFLAMYNKVNNFTAGLNMEENAMNYRGDEEGELNAEIQSMATVLGVPAFHIQGQSMSGPFQTMKGPLYTYLKATGKPMMSDEKMLKTMTDPNFLKRFPKFGCTGILAKDSKDGTVWHARNLDFGFSRHARKMTYTALFKKGGKELFTGQMIFPVPQVLTAIRRGPNGYSYELNTRFGDTIMDTQILMGHLFMEKRPLSLWSVRKALEDNDNYEGFVKAMSETPFPNKEYAIISGVKKGVVLARDPDGLAYRLDLDDKTPYIVMTNYDSSREDPKEWLPDYKHKGISGYVKAMSLMKESADAITPQLLKKVLQDEEVAVNETIASTLINVEHDTFKSSLPHCPLCCDSTNCDPIDMVGSNGEPLPEKPTEESEKPSV